MKIRTLLLKRNLQQIQKQYSYIFVFHCSGLNHFQWKQFKNFLHMANIEGRRLNNKHAIIGVASRRNENSHFVCFANKDNRRLTLGPSLFLRSKKPLVKDNKVKAVGKQLCGTFFIPSGRLKLNLSAPLVGRLHTINSKLMFNSGPLCIIYFNREQVNNINKFWSEIITKMSLLGTNTNLVLLYAQIETVLMNHMDLKQVLKLETNSAFQSFLWSVLSPTQDLCSSMLQPIHELSPRIEVRGNSQKNSLDSGLCVAGSKTLF